MPSFVALRWQWIEVIHVPPHEVRKHIALGVNRLRHSLLSPIERLDDHSRVGLVPALLLNPRAGVDNLLPLAICDAVVRLVSLAQPVGILGDRVPSSVRITTGVCREVVDSALLPASS